MAELADAQDLGSCGKPCRFDPCYPHPYTCRCSSVVEHQLPKLNMRVRFPSSAFFHFAGNRTASIFRHLFSLFYRESNRLDIPSSAFFLEIYHLYSILPPYIVQVAFFFHILCVPYTRTTSRCVIFCAQHAPYFIPIPHAIPHKKLRKSLPELVAISYSPSCLSVSRNRLRNSTGSMAFTTTALSAGICVSTDMGTVRSKKITCP